MKSCLLISVTTCLLVMISCGKKPHKGYPEEANKATVVKIMEAFASANLEIINDLVSENYVEHFPDERFQSTGKQNLIDACADYIKSFPDQSIEIKHITADNDIVMAFYTYRGTNTGDMMGMPATGKQVEVNATDVFKIEDGKAVEHWGVFDVAEFMTQLGFVFELAEEVETAEENSMIN